jgi:hypothetical protein
MREHLEELAARLLVERICANRLWLPMSLLPRARAYKEVVRGRYHFDVAISVLLAGQVLRYHGQLELRSNPAG